MRDAAIQGVGALNRGKGLQEDNLLHRPSGVPQDAERPARGHPPAGLSRRMRRASAHLLARGTAQAKKSALRERDALPSRSLALQYSRRRRA